MDDFIRQRDLTLLVQRTEELRDMLMHFREMRRTALHVGAPADVVARWDDHVRMIELELQFRAEEDAEL